MGICVYKSLHALEPGTLQMWSSQTLEMREACKCWPSKLYACYEHKDMSNFQTWNLPSLCRHELAGHISHVNGSAYARTETLWITINISVCLYLSVSLYLRLSLRSSPGISV